MRYEHHLTRTRGSQYPTQLVAVEADGFPWDAYGRPRVRGERLADWHAAGCQGQAGRYCAEHLAYGLDADEWWDALARRLRRGGHCWVVSHRACRVGALLGLWDRLTNGRLRHAGTDHRSAKSEDRGKVGRPGGHMTLADPPVCVWFRMRGLPGTVRWLDARNWGLPDPPDGETAADRVIRLLDFMRHMVGELKDNGLGTLQQTVASQALYSFRRTHYTYPVYCHAGHRALGLEAAGLYGGRCECFRLGRWSGPVAHVDCRALYPSLCAERPLPGRLLGMATAFPSRSLPAGMCAQACVADVTVSTDEPAYPRRDGELTCYPVGIYRTVLCGPELADALSRGRVREIHQAAVYEMRPVLASWARCVLDGRRRAEAAADPDMAGWWKALGVSLVGKFAQRDRRWVDSARGQPDSPWGCWWDDRRDGTSVHCRAVAWHVQREVDTGWSADAAPAVAAWVTSLGRLWALETIRAAGWDEVLYLDTDGLLITLTGLERLAVAGRIASEADGMLRLVRVYDWVELYGIKDYEAPGRVVRAGPPQGAADRGPEPHTWWYRQRAAEWARQGQCPRAEAILRRVSRGGVYRHGVRGADGRVSPHVLGGSPGGI